MGRKKYILGISTRVMKIIILLLIIVGFTSSFTAKAASIWHLTVVEFNMASYSLFGISMALIGSIALLLLVLIDRVVYKRKVISKNPLQMLALVGGLFGVVYYGFLLFKYLTVTF